MAEEISRVNLFPVKRELEDHNKSIQKKQAFSSEGNDSMLGIRSHDGHPMMGDKTINVEGGEVIVALLRILGSRLLCIL